MPSELKKLGTRFFRYLVIFVLAFSFIMLIVLGLQTRALRKNISDSFTEFSDDINEVSRKIMSDDADKFIKNYVNIESNAFAYIVNELKSNLKYLSDGLKLRYDDYEKNGNYYLNIANTKLAQGNLQSDSEKKKRTKVFFQTGIDRNSLEVKKDLGILYDMEDDLLLTITDALQERNCYVVTEGGVSLFACDYDFSNSPKYEGEEIDFRNEDWYQRTLATSSIVFNSVYKDVLSGKEIISVEKSFSIGGKKHGVIVIEIYIDSLSNNSISLKPPEGVNLFIVDSNGKIVYNARANLYSNEIAKQGTLFPFLDESRKKQSGRGSYIYNGNEYRCFYKKVNDTNFTLYVSIKENRLEESVNKLQSLVEEKNDSLLDMVFSTTRNLYIYVLIFAIFLTIAIFFVAKGISKMLETPINELSNILEQASKIQKDMLPEEFEKISNRRDIEIYAKNIPETEVGGDFYNYIIRNNKLYLIIADVSGSGMPAALFMAKTNTLLNNAISLSESPRVILSYVNTELCKNNKECYFVTIALYCIDLKTRKVVFANSGHENSIIIKHNNDLIVKEEVRSAPMGLDEFNKYNEDEFILDKGDVLFLYTDGVVEAIDKDEKLFGMDRLVNELKAIGPTNTKDIVLGIEKKLSEFSTGVEQYDDITMLCFKFKQLDIDESKVLKNEKTFTTLYGSIDEAYEFVENCLSNAYDDKAIYEKYLSQFYLCIEEIAVNICDYAFEKPNDPDHSFIVRVLIDKNVDKLSISFIDEGKEFDPTQMKDVNILQGIDERHIGGFGIHITKNIVDILEYNREDNKNVLTLTKYL